MEKKNIDATSGCVSAGKPFTQCKSTADGGSEETMGDDIKEMYDKAKKAFEEYQKQQEALRQQYLYDKTSPAEVLPEGVLGPTRPGSTSMNPFLKSMRDSGVPDPVVQFLQNNPQATKEDIQAALDITSKMAAQASGRGDYGVPIDTVEHGYVFADTRNKQFIIPEKRLTKPTSSPTLQGAISGTPVRVCRSATKAPRAG